VPARDIPYKAARTAYWAFVSPADDNARSVATRQLIATCQIRYPVVGEAGTVGSTPGRVQSEL
jgi:hypothetical protein